MAIDDQRGAQLVTPPQGQEQLAHALAQRDLARSGLPDRRDVNGSARQRPQRVDVRARGLQLEQAMRSASRQAIANGAGDEQRLRIDRVDAVALERQEARQPCAQLTPKRDRVEPRAAQLRELPYG